jgi:hypothetical protein
MIRSIHRQPAYQRILTSRWVAFPLLLILGFAGGLLGAGYVWAKSGYEFLPAEIVVQPPPPNVIACFPDQGFIGALKLRQELAQQMQQQHQSQYSEAVLRSSLRACVGQSDSLYTLTLLRVSPTHYSVVAAGRGGTTALTLATEKGCFYLHPIPKRRDEKYDSLIQLRYLQQAQLGQAAPAD